MRIRREPRLRTPPDRLLAVEAFESGGFFSTATTVGLTLGLALMVMIYAVGRVSGAHVNPVVSVGAAVGGRLAWNQVPVYVASQLVGAVLGAAVLFGLLHGFENFQAEGGMGQNAFGSESPANYALWASLLLELVLTTVFVWVILAVTDARNAHPASRSWRSVSPWSRSTSWRSRPPAPRSTRRGRSARHCSRAATPWRRSGCSWSARGSAERSRAS